MATASHVGENVTFTPAFALLAPSNSARGCEKGAESPFFSRINDLRLITGIPASSPFVPPVPLCNVLNFPQKRSIMQDKRPSTIDQLLLGFDSAQKNAQGCTDDLGILQPGQSPQLNQKGNVTISQAERGFLHAKGYQSRVDEDVALEQGSVNARPSYGVRKAQDTETLARVTNRDKTKAPSLSYSPVGLGNRVSESVCEYLAWCEDSEPNVWLRDDIRIAWLTVVNAAQGKPDAWRYSFWMYLGRTPEKLIPEFVARAERHRLMNVPDYDPTVKMAQAPAESQKRKEIA